MKAILLIMIGLSISIQADRFSRDDTTNIVTDTTTNLQWQDEPYTQAEEDAYNDNKEEGKVLYWQSAIDYCEALELGGKDDWRLPNFNELYYIADRSRYNNAIYLNSFDNVVSNYYWSSTTYASVSDNAWIVNFNDGDDGNYGKSYSYFVRCVRAGNSD